MRQFKIVMKIALKNSDVYNLYITFYYKNLLLTIDYFCFLDEGNYYSHIIW